VASRFSSNRRESNSDGARLSFCGEDVCHAQVIERVGSSVCAVGASALCVNDTFGDTFAVEMRYKVDKVMVLEKEWAILAYSLDLVGVGVWYAVGCAVNNILRFGIAVVSITAELVAVL
jgi:hypothetical protein